MAAVDKTNPNYKHIVRVANVDLPGEKTLRIALADIKGIGINFADAVCNAAGIDKNVRTGHLTDEQVKRLNEFVNNPGKYDLPTWLFNRRKDYETSENIHVLSGTLHFVHENDLKRLKKIKTLRGARHIKGLPVRGQRTRSNFRRNKGKVVGVAKKKAEPGAAAKKDEGAKGKKEKK
jgi:small subunit ribosomal protein S13